MKNQFKIDKNKFKAHWAYYLALTIALAATGGAYAYTHQSTKNDDSIVVKQDKAGAGTKNSEQEDSEDSKEDTAKTTTNTSGTKQPSATTSNKPLITPAGQILNTNNVSLSATSGQFIPNLESTVLQGTAGATVSIVASLNGGADKTVASAGQLNSSGQYPEPINWNAKDTGLTPGNWNIRIKTTLGGQTAYSQPAILTVSP